MALEDRDWYRAEPSKAWKRRWDSPAGAGPPRRPLGSRPSAPRLHQGAWVAVVATAVLASATWHFHLLDHVPGVGKPRPTAAQPFANARMPAQPQPGPPASAGNVVRLRLDARGDTPATTVSRWTVTDPRFGRISIYVPVGETPRKALTIALAARGYQVVP